MKLKSVEIYGFKSFYNKIKLDFENSITAIIGPNGSGKSNISDAILWVLGEQSAKSLRGIKMEDVIFGGTSAIAPLNFTQVSITFDNSDKTLPIDYNEIVIKRKMYRNGESEYYINNSLCRRKDVRELFMDTGVGKEGYSIIGQGKIDEILDSKPEERRNIFEEAAGISKYRYKKEEAIRKLKAAEENLSTIEIVIEEKREKVDYLKLQAEKAKKGIELIQNIKAIDLSVQKYELKNIENEIKGFIGKSEALQNELEKVKGEEKTLKTGERKYLDDLEISEKSFEEFQKIQSDLQSGILSLKNETNLLEQSETYNLKDVKRLKEEVNYKESERNKINLKFLELQKEIKNDETEFVKLNEKSKQKSKDRENLKNIIEDMHNLKREHLLKESKLNSEKEELLFLKERAKGLNDSKKEELAALNEKKEEIEKTILSHESNLAETNKIIADEENRLMELKETGLRLRDEERERLKEKEKIEKSLSEFEIKKKNVENKCAFLSNLIINFEGFNKNVRELMKLSQADVEVKNRIKGVFAELIEIEYSFEKSINAALGGTLQNIITDTSEDAKWLIEKLKENKIGKLTFLPISSITSSNLSKVEDSDIIAIASEKVKGNGIGNIIGHFLNGTVIVENLNKALKVKKKYGNRFRIVTLDGDLINTWGSMVGGFKSKSEASDIINRRSELKNLNNLIFKINEDTKKKFEEYEKIIKDSGKNRELILSNSEKIVDLEDKLKYKKNYKREIEVREEILKSNLKDIEEKILKFSSTQVFDENKAKLLEEKILDIEKIKKEREDLEKEILKHEFEFQELDKEIIIIKNSVEKFERDIFLKKNQSNSLSDEKANLIKNFDLTLSEIEHIEETIEKDRNMHREVLEKIKKKTKELYDMKLKVKEEKEILQKFKDERNVFENKLKIIFSEENRLEKDLNLCLIKIENLINKEKEIKSYLMEEYSLKESDIKELFENVKESSYSKSKLKSLKEELKNLGAFGYEAIEEYEKIKADFEFLTDQRDDLVSSKENIEDVIRKLESKMSVKFRTEMKKIDRKFDEIFKILFNGGNAKIEYESDDILNSGVDIVAQLPGSRLQKLSLLSGGEKSLTVIAILFAIFEINPSPFCILDEIDAALDDANIDRYKNYLKSFKDTTQFIIITHRKSTMEIADLLYGVSMENEGISKVISLNLKEV